MTGRICNNKRNLQRRSERKSVRNVKSCSALWHVCIRSYLESVL